MKQISLEEINEARETWLKEAGIDPLSDTAAIFTTGWNEAAVWILKQMKDETSKDNLS